jgi:hypothetical protein
MLAMYMDAPEALVAAEELEDEDEEDEDEDEDEEDEDEEGSPAFS